MIDLRDQVRGLFKGLDRAGTPNGEGGRLVMFISAHAGDGASSMAAATAMVAAESVRKPAWLLDLDLMSNQHFANYAVGGFAKTFGGVGRPYSALLKTKPFFSIEPDDDDEDLPSEIFTVHRVGETRLMVTQFNEEKIPQGKSVRIRTRPDYWKAVRTSTDWTVVDAPARDISPAGLAVASQMDVVVIVARADHTEPAEIEALRCEIERHGGRVAGVVLNRMGRDAPFFDRLAR